MGDDVRLRPVGESDLPVIYRLTSDPDCTGEHEWFGWQDPWRYRRRWEQDGLLGEDGGVLAVEHQDELAGLVSWRKQRMGRVSFCWNLGIALLPQARGRGFGTIAQRQVVRYLFMHTQVNRIEASTEITNLAEQHALTNAGFTREGVTRGAAFQAGRWHDAVVYSVLRSEVEL
jgi:RimJ/RimL family protein N-acetyltransferase